MTPAGSATRQRPAVAIWAKHGDEETAVARAGPEWLPGYRCPCSGTENDTAGKGKERGMARSTALSDAAVDLQVVREFLERYFTIENEIKVLQQDKSALRDEFKGRGLDMKTMTAAIAIAKKRQLVPVSRETLDVLISEVEEKLPAPED